MLCDCTGMKRFLAIVKLLLPKQNMTPTKKAFPNEATNNSKLIKSTLRTEFHMR